MMKKVLISLSIFLISAAGFSQDEVVNIPDTNFLNALIDEGVDLNKDGKIQKSEAESNSIISLDLSNHGISNLKGVEAFINLSTIKASNNNLTDVEIKGLSQLTFLQIDHNPNLHHLSIVGLTKLESLFISDNNLSNLNIINSPNIIQLTCSNNQLQLLNIDSLNNLTLLLCENNLIKHFSFNLIENLSIYNNPLETLSSGKKSKLSYLYIDSTNITTLDSNITNSLIILSCSKSKLSELDLRNSTLETLHSLNNVNNLKVCVSDLSDAEFWVYDSLVSISNNCEPLALSEKQSTEKSQVLKTYNLQGQEVPANTKGEVIILLYDNGTREKTYVAE